MYIITIIKLNKLKFGQFEKGCPQSQKNLFCFQEILQIKKNLIGSEIMKIINSQDYNNKCNYKSQMINEKEVYVLYYY